MAVTKINIDILRKLLDYDSETGLLRWKVYRGRLARAGSIAGSKSKSGYINIKIRGCLHCAQKICWGLHFGLLTDLSLDHKNGIRDDNRIANLREATRSQNMANAYGKSRSGLPKGVTRKNSKFQAEIRCNGERTYLGVFETPESAHAAYCDAAKLHFGNFWYDGVSDRG